MNFEEVGSFKSRPYTSEGHHKVGLYLATQGREFYVAGAVWIVLI